MCGGDRVAYVVVVGLVGHIPRTGPLSLMYRRELYGGKARLGNAWDFLFDLSGSPVKTVQYDTVLNVVFQTIGVVGKGNGTYAQCQRQCPCANMKKEFVHKTCKNTIGFYFSMVFKSSSAKIVKKIYGRMCVWEVNTNYKAQTFT